MAKLSRILAVLVFLVPSWPAQAAGTLKVGVGKTVITPPELKTSPIKTKVWLAGFDCGRAATAVHDDLEARAIILDDGNKRIGIVVVDLIGLFYDETEKIRREINASPLHLDLFLIASTHDHSAPDTLGIWGRNHLSRGVRRGYLEFVRAQAINALTQASQTLTPVHVRIAQGSAPELMFDTRDPIIKDDGYDILQFTDANNGKTLATLVDWGNHPETMGSRNTVVTSDFPHWVRRRLEEKLGGTAVYITSSLGGLMTTLGVHLADENGRPIPDCSFEKTEKIGTLLADKMIKSLKESGEELTDIKLDFRNKTLFVPMQNPAFRLMARLGVIQRDTYTHGKRISWGVGKDIKTEVNILRLGPVQFATVPGELFPELEKGLPEGFKTDQSPEHTSHYEVPLWINKILNANYEVTLGLTSDEIGYIVPECDFVKAGPLGGHKSGHYEESMSLGRKTASLLLNALRDLAE